VDFLGWAPVTVLEVDEFYYTLKIERPLKQTGNERGSRRLRKLSGCSTYSRSWVLSGLKPELVKDCSSISSPFY